MTGLNDVSRAARRKRQRTLAARNVIVPSFPEIIQKETQCRLCSLVEDAPDVLRAIHDYYQQGLGGRALVTRCGEIWAERGVAPPHHRSYERHFKQHVNFSEVNLAVGESMEEDFSLPSGDDLVAPPPPIHTRAGSPPGTLTPAPPPEVQLPEPRAEDIEAGAGDYFTMESLIIRLQARVDQLDKDTAFVDRDGRVNTYGIVIWLKLISELRQALESLNRMRNGDRLTKSIIQATVKRNAVLTSAPLIQRFQLIIELLRNGTPETAAAELEKLTGGDIGAIMLKAAEEAVRESCEVYKLQ